MKLSLKTCTPCTKKTPPLQGKMLLKFKKQLSSDWTVINHHHLVREFRFRNFKEALDFTNKIGALAEQEGHHPDIYLTWGKVRLEVWTHKIDGLSANDFIFAAKCDRLQKPTVFPMTPLA